MLVTFVHALTIFLVTLCMFLLVHARFLTRHCRTHLRLCCARSQQRDTHGQTQQRFLEHHFTSLSWKPNHNVRYGSKYPSRLLLLRAWMYGKGKEE